MDLPVLVRTHARLFRRAGQACTSTQKLFVHEQVFDRFTDLFVGATRALKVGDPHDPATVIGPMISEQEARRAETLVAAAGPGFFFAPHTGAVDEENGVMQHLAIARMEFHRVHVAVRAQA